MIRTPLSAPSRSSELLAAIHAAPDDDGPRLVYADALTEAGDPRGEFIIRQLRGDRDILPDPAWIPANIREPRFERGFLVAGRIAGASLAAVADPLIRELVVELDAGEDWDHDGDITATPYSGGVWTEHVDEAQVALLARCDGFPALKRLVVEGLPMTGWMRAILTGPVGKRLDELGLRYTGWMLERAPIAELVGWKTLPPRLVVELHRILVIRVIGDAAQIEVAATTAPETWVSLAYELSRIVGALRTKTIAISAPDGILQSTPLATAIARTASIVSASAAVLSSR